MGTVFTAEYVAEVLKVTEFPRTELTPLAGLPSSPRRHQKGTRAEQHIVHNIELILNIYDAKSYDY